MNKYFKLLTGCIMSLIAGVSISVINPVVFGVVAASAGVTASLYFFARAE